MALKTPAALPPGARILVDSTPIAYVLDGHAMAARYLPLFRLADEGLLQLFVTPITIAEVVAGPLARGREAQAEQYRLALTPAAGFGILPLGDDTAFLAARLRVRYKLKLPGAFQLAACILNGCEALATHDRDFRRVTEVDLVDVG
jgi:predicted nucleic acid-binding protein